MQQNKHLNMFLLTVCFTAYKLTLLLSWNENALDNQPWEIYQPNLFIFLIFTWSISAASALLGFVVFLFKRTLSWNFLGQLLSPAFILTLLGNVAFLTVLLALDSLPLLVVAACILSIGLTLFHIVWIVCTFQVRVLELMNILASGEILTVLFFLALKRTGVFIQALFLIAICITLLITTKNLVLQNKNAQNLDWCPPSNNTNRQNSLHFGIAISSLSIGILWGSSQFPHEYTLWSFGAIITCITFPAVTILHKKKTKLDPKPETLIRAVLIILAASILLMTIVPNPHPIFMTMVWVGYSVLSLCLFLLEEPSEHKNNRNGMMLIFTLAAFYASTAIGLIMGHIINKVASFIEVPAIVAAVLLLAFTLLSDTFTTTNRTKPNTQKLQINAESITLIDIIRSNCKNLAESHALTQAEYDILLYLVRGYTINRIAEERTVSPNTIKSQISSIYTKLNIHSKQDLLDMLENQ